MENKWKKIWMHPWIVAACNILIIMGIYSVSRFFFYYFNKDLYPDVSVSHLFEMLFGGIRFDLTALLYLNALYLLLTILPLPTNIRNHSAYITTAKWAYLIPNILGILVNCMDMVYVRFTGRRTTCRVLEEFQNDDNIGSIIWQSIWQYWYVTLFCVILIAILCVVMRKKWSAPTYPQKLYYTIETAIMLLTIYFVVIGIRGGFGRYTRPITISNALQYTNTPQETAILLNTPFTLLKSLENSTYANPHYFSDSEIEKHMTPIHTCSMDTVASTTNMVYPIKTGKLGKTNVVILILESFSKEFIGFYNKHISNGTYKGYTPFLDSLLPHCITYKYSFASGRKSIDAMPTILSSIPSMIEPYIVSQYSTNEVSSIADCLRKEGYYTAFFHGAPNGSMGFEAYARAAGFEDYFGMDEYNNNADFDGTWAIWDEEFLQYYARSMNQMKKPFMTAVFTASSHHPYKIPEKYNNQFPKGNSEIHQCIGYTDYALRKFFEYAQQQDWYQNTLFVLTADHTSNQISLPEYNNSKGLFEVPIAFFSPQWDQGYFDQSSAVNQVDIMPSIINYVDYKKDYFAFGEDILTRAKKHPYAICYNDPVHQIFSDSLLVQFDGQDVTAVYNYQTDPKLAKNIKDKVNVDQMTTYLKAYIQQYINRMINNQLTIHTNGSKSR
ncbi:MAG: LTA synthase family protein [Paludibacteraceae bacterium]|nr:LTA synthase family protein [Paludibacteraceae bacterium]MBQ5775220.1 LTA synthase family protein [Paludibacteraceae bacterium]